MTEECYRCGRIFEREPFSTEYVTDFHDIMCDECWEETS
jgi:hypothetical protein